MKNTGMRRLHYLLVVTFLAALTGCGASNSGTAAAPGAIANGAVAAKLMWGGSVKSAAKSVASIPAGPDGTAITTLQMTVTGPNVPVVRSTIAVTGSTTSGTVNGIYPGSMSLVVQALNAAGVIEFEGFALNVAVTSGNTTNVGTIYMTPPIVKAADTQCIGCHEVTVGADGGNVVAEYKQSSHYSNTAFTDANGVAAGCTGCHGPSHNTPDPSALLTSSSVFERYSATSVRSTRCFDCHNINNDNVALVGNHDKYYLANGNPCASCHQVHNTMAANQERRDWATSRHGATDFANISLGGSGGCALRCHNAAGYIAAVANPSVPLSGLTAATMSPAPQMVTCNACHTNAPLGTLRALPGTVATAFATYTTSSKGYQFAPNQTLNPNKKAWYPDVAGSNLCIVCHSGTTEGFPTKLGMSDPYFAGSAAALTYTNNGTLSPKTTLTPHNMPAAAVMYVKFGFTNLSTGAAGVPSQAYLNSLTSDLDAAPGTAGTVTSTHRKFGTSAIRTDSHFSAGNPAPANFLTNGPCAVCHVSGSHTYRIDQAAIDAVCSHCHTAENGNSIATAANFQALFLDPQQEVYNNAILLGITVLNNRVAAYNLTAPGLSTPLVLKAGIDPSTSPQPGKVVFYDTVNADGTGNTYAADGTLNVHSATLAEFQAAAVALGYSATGSDLGFQKFMGALSNLAFFAKDQGGFAHARTYSRRLIYDSIDYLDDGVLNRSVSATALAASSVLGSPVNGLYTKAANAYYNNGLTGTAQTITTVYPGTSESMIYLIGWSRSTGAWAAVERP